METLEYTPQGVCSKKISIKVEDGILKDLIFTKGCEGNLKAIATLTKGMKISDIIEKLEGNTCGKRNTSCADQLTKALRTIKE
ncbi:MAG: TIGR03905 family TSCPD domain-containing protein [Marinifilaceae bacterium]